MKIVVLDGNALNPGDLSWSGIEAFGQLKVYPRTPKESVVSRASGADIILTNKVALDAVMLSCLKDVKYIGLLSTGYNIVDLEYCKNNKIVVCNIPAYSTFSVAQMTFALLLEIAVATKTHSDSVKAGQWSQCLDFCYWKQNIIELSGKTFGIVGYGQIGRQVAEVAKSLGMNVIIYSRHKSDDDLRFCSLQQLYLQSDIISLHCPLNEQSSGMINAVAISQMKDGVIILNTARGGLVDEVDLVAALNNKKVFAYGADVLSQEPPKEDNALIACPNAIITPHIAWASYSARNRLLSIAVQNIKGFLEGNIQNCVYKI